MQTGALYFKQNNDYIQFFPFAWNGEQGSNYLFDYLVTVHIFVRDGILQKESYRLEHADWNMLMGAHQRVGATGRVKRE